MTDDTGHHRAGNASSPVDHPQSRSAEVQQAAVHFTISAEDAGVRLDAFLARELPDYSRTHLRRAISAGGVNILPPAADDDSNHVSSGSEQRRGKPSYRLRPGERLRFLLPEIPREAPRPENIPLDVLYEDEHMVAVNKPPGMVVHPSRGHWSGTLASALQFHYGQSLSATGGPSRPGIVHRLDRDTSGVLVVARTDVDHAKLSAQFAERTTQKEYFAIGAGRLDRDRDVIRQPIGTHPHQREKMAIYPPSAVERGAAREAETFIEVLERFGDYMALRVQPKTGRTHQIRVHLTHVHCPVLCDRLYGGRSQITRGELLGTDDDTVLLARQALHARRVTITHPATGERMTFEAPLPDDIQQVLDVLRTIS